MKVGLLNSSGVEIIYPGYKRMPIEWRTDPNGFVHFGECITFPKPDDTWMGFAYVAAIGVWDDDETTLLANIGLPCSNRIDSGITLTFNAGETRVAMRHMRHMRAQMPTNCKKCNLYNEYVGPEHLTNGEYICRSCKR